MHRLGGYGIPAIPTQPQNYLPTEFTEHTETTGGEYPPTDCTDFHRCSLMGCSSLCCTNKAVHAPTLQSSHRLQKTSGARYSPTDCTDMHRLGGYGIPAIPTQPQNYLPTEFTEHTETTGGEYPPTDCTDFHRCSLMGCSSLCCTNKAVHAPTLQSSHRLQKTSGARYSPTDCTDMHRLGGYGIPAIPTQPQNYPPTEFAEHRNDRWGISSA